MTNYVEVNIDKQGENDVALLVGREIASAKLENDTLSLAFTDGTSAQLWDGGQSCCETRYVTTDDDPVTLVGNCIVSITTKQGPYVREDYQEHEQVFVEVQTTGGFITLVTHNEHNGYYGGFSIRVKFAQQHVETPQEKRFKRRLKDQTFLGKAVF
jgi:hypothetical protein